MNHNQPQIQQQQQQQQPQLTKQKTRRARQPKDPQISVARRNERERNRVKMVNNAFENLREHLPDELVERLVCDSKGKGKKFSKVETLRTAIQHIKNLVQILNGPEQAQSNQQVASPLSWYPSPASSSMSVSVSVASEPPATQEAYRPKQYQYEQQQQHQHHYLADQYPAEQFRMEQCQKAEQYPTDQQYQQAEQYQPDDQYHQHDQSQHGHYQPEQVVADAFVPLHHAYQHHQISLYSQ